MIGKIKELMEVKKELQDVTTQVAEQKKAMGELTTTISTFTNELQSLKQSQKELITELSGDKETFAQLQDELHKEISDFKLVKSRMEKKLVDRFSEELRTELLPRFKRIEQHVREFEELSGKVNTITSRTVAVSDEMQKFLTISQNIKTGDFELTRHAKNLKSVEHDKLELMRKIDRLERLVATQRRKLA